MLLEINRLDFSYLDGKKLFQNFNLKLGKGKIIALAGESGCGKSTLLSLIYGLLDWQNGEIIFKDASLKGPKGNLVPGEKQMKLVAQNYDLMPYATVYDNIGKYISNINLIEKKERVSELLEVVGLKDCAKVLPKNLSGGQQQRVAIARALSVLPELLLLDEPFSNLDSSRKHKLRDQFFSFVKDKGLSVIISTHDLEEILPWVDQIIVLKDGRLIQNDSPERTYQEPYDEYVARLLGEVNVFSDDEKNSFNLNKSYYFPNQIKVSEDGLEADLVESRFAGSYYWNKLKINHKNIIVYSEQKLIGSQKLIFDE